MKQQDLTRNDLSLLVYMKFHAKRMREIELLEEECTAELTELLQAYSRGEDLILWKLSRE